MLRTESAVLKVEGLVKAYRSLRAVDGLSLRVEAGSIVALMGPNGAGKTTTIKCILGVTDFAGTVEVDGWSVKRRGKAARSRIGYLPQVLTMNDRDNCEEALRFLADLRGVQRWRTGRVLELVNLADQRGTRIGHLSGGMRQRLALAAALLSDPPLLLLDEPTASLDQQSRRDFHDLLLRLRGEGKAVLLSTHFLDRLHELVDRIVVLHRGRAVFEGSAEEMTSLLPARRYIVDANGTGAAALREALHQAGIGPEQVQPVELQWDELLLAALQGREAGNVEERP